MSHSIRRFCFLACGVGSVLASLDDETTLLQTVGRLTASKATLRSADIVKVGVAGSRNVTQMANMLQAMALDSTHGDGVTLDADIQASLGMIKSSLVGTIRDAIKDEHKLDQKEIMKSLDCFKECKAAKSRDDVNLGNFKNRAQTLKESHETCRGTVYKLYVKKIVACRDLDAWVSKLRVPAFVPEACLDPEQSQMGSFFQGLLSWATNNHNIWKDKHKTCLDATRMYIEADNGCDKKQAEWEQASCILAAHQWSTCNVEYTACRAACIKNFHEEVERVECAEKDRKIDWSATEKIECYIDMLLASPTDEELKKNCGEEKNCLNKFREEKFNECSELCEEVDFKNEDGEYKVVDGVNTTHRHPTDANAERRCTRHLDINFQSIPCADRCEPLVSSIPCEDDFITEYYAVFDQTTQVEDVKGRAKCIANEHATWWAYNRADCQTCPGLQGKQHIEDNYCEHVPSPVPIAEYEVNGELYDLANWENEAKLWNDRDYMVQCSREMQKALFWLQPHKAISSGSAHIKNLPLGSRVYVATEATGGGRAGGIEFSDEWLDLGQACSWHGHGKNVHHFNVQAMSIRTEEDRTIALTIKSPWVGFVAYKVDQPVIGITTIEAKFSHCPDEVVTHFGDQSLTLACKVNEFSCGAGKHQSDQGECQVQMNNGRHEVRACFVDRCAAQNAWQCAEWGESSSVDLWMDVACKVTTPVRSIAPPEFEGKCEHDPSWDYVMDYRDEAGVNDIPDTQVEVARGFANKNAYYVGNAFVEKMDIVEAQLCHFTTTNACAGQCTTFFNKENPAKSNGNPVISGLSIADSTLTTDVGKLIAMWSGQQEKTATAMNNWGMAGDRSWSCWGSGWENSGRVEANLGSVIGWHFYNFGITLDIRGNLDGSAGKLSLSNGHEEIGWWRGECGLHGKDDVVQVRVRTSLVEN